jgi:hypothetical protein
MARLSLGALGVVLLLAACTAQRSSSEEVDVDAGVAASSKSALTRSVAQQEEPNAIAVVRESAKTNAALAYAFAHGDGLFAQNGKLSSPGDKVGDTEHLAARFPATAEGTVEVDVARMARLRIALTPVGAKPVQAKLFGGRAVYEDAFPSTDVVALGNAFYAEHLLVLRDAAAKPSVSYRVDLGKGLTPKWEDKALVLADARGEGRLRVIAPYAVDARGVVREATMTLDRGELRISLDPTGLAYPIVLDPAVESFVWQKMTPTKSPSPRNDTAMAYDPARKVTVLYGGSPDITSSVGVAETWEYDGTTWTQRCGAPLAACALPALARHVMAYDAAISATWLHGAEYSTSKSWLGKWNGTSWTTTSPTTAPGYWNGAAAYDSKRSDVVELAGWTNPGQTWLWHTAGTWEQAVTISNCTTDSPHCALGPAMAYHAVTDQMLMFGGFDIYTSAPQAVTWVYDGTSKTWSSVLPGSSPIARGYAAMAYDSARKRSVLFGGRQSYTIYYDDTYEWNGSNWLPITPLTKPAAREQHAMVYDSARGRMVVFGGQVLVAGTATLTGETWEYHSRGAACTTNAECDTGKCIDGVCCESTCGTCERCNDTTPGTCTKVFSADDADSCAAPTATCDSAGVCKKRQGQSCTTGTDCLNGICVDGVCCASGCAGTCQACKSTLKADGSADGTCGAAKSGTNPHGDCTSGVGGACGQTGTCDGVGKCTLQVSGTSCGTGAVCTGTVAKGQQCDGLGTCVTKATGTECAPGLCVSGTGCKITCATNSECATSAYCDTSTAPGQCKTKKAAGGACTTGSQCATGFCIDGVCCNSLCNEKCQACSAATKESGMDDGVCGAAKNGLNPHSDCIAGSGGACGQTGFCDGAGSCSLATAGKSCGTGSVCEGTVAKGQQCDGLGACVNNPTGTDCVPAKCSMGCTTTCASDSDCDSSGFCDTSVHKCASKKKNGTACGAANECDNPFCVDGVCCNKPCGGQCEACNTKDAPGTCVPVNGAPIAPREACKAEPATSCQQTTCNGVDGTKCAGFVGAEVTCQAGACTDGKAVGEVHCDGKGNCPADAPKVCEPYACGDMACKSSCTTNADCHAPATCDTATSKCVNAAKCDGEHTLTSADGKTTTDCTPYNCDASGTCKSSCAGSSECASPNICSVGVCVAPAADSSDSGGCALTRGKSDESRGAPFALMLLALVAVRRSRR